MGQKKLVRFAAIKTFNNVLEYPQDIKGKWAEHFGNNNPVVLELACGKGEYTVGLSKMYPLKNFIGVDIKGNRIWVGAKKALEGNLANAAFLRTQIQKLEEYFTQGEVSEIWITFPDPQLTPGKAKKRLTHPRFLLRYQQVLAKGGVIHLKTDSPNLYEFTKKVINLFSLNLLEDYDDVYAQAGISEELKIKTHYEQLDIAQSNRIHYLKFSLGEGLPADAEEQLKKVLSEEEAGGR
ncbi:tRNA (guanosine(46)-N7)-methyltransferase TrmB [Aridibaculum aurantiacum]|uniref:tRNA (guanosine(46)-N7)-methyltransferase TrmB n=1 Tax=Aridibaculum aurantiacum TaxID=2810307 RepID=UPI001A95E972|nr:tRNA (guanosine(46)-N7)-methyltransferase TrmB [Aridibaculum aurantiacum]